jgi:hypothetical protein
MACLRNLLIGMLSQAGPVNLAAMLRHHARPLATLGSTPWKQPRTNRRYERTPGLGPMVPLTCSG